MQEELIKLKTEEGNHIALWKISTSASSNTKNVLLTHGTFSDRRVLKGISEFLALNGYTCWIFEWRNHGSSSDTDELFDFETIGIEDFRVVLDYLITDCNISQLDCITHSGGGISLTIALIHHPDYQINISSITMFGCQAYGAGLSTINCTKIHIGKYISKLLGYIPAKIAGRQENESYHTMKQWYDWNLTGEYKGRSGVDYKEKMKSIKIPVLSISGAGDTFIAPPEGCQMYLEAFNNPKNQYLYCSKSNGYTEDYNHSRIIQSRNALKEIYPQVKAWIDKHSDQN